jgi:hypothetical protein
MASLHQPVFAALAKFRASWPRRGWSYDNRFMCVASTFDAESAATARALIEPILPHSWTSRSIGAAPRPFPDISERTGGLRSAQIIFGADPVGRLVPYGLWWPWEEGRTISLRIGLEGSSPGDTMELCNAFGAEM